MKMRKLIILGSALLLSACSLGAQGLTNKQFKEIFDKEIKITSVESVRASKSSLQLKKEERNISAKTLVENEYVVNASDVDDLKTAGNSLSANHRVTNYVTKEIINSAGVRTFTDVSKNIVETTYQLINYVEGDVKELQFKKIEETEVVKTDYLSVELDATTGRIATAEMIIDDNLYALSGKSVKFDTFVKDGDGESSEDAPDEGLDVKDITLAGTKWTLSDSTGAFKDAIIEVSADVDTTASSRVKVGTINYDSVEHELFVFEVGEGSYNFEIRETTINATPKDEQITKAVAYDASDVAEKAAAAIDEFFAQDDVKDFNDAIVNRYQETLQYIENTCDDNHKLEILYRETGIAYRCMEGTKYTEVSIDAARKGEEDNSVASRPVKRIVERQGLQGNEILAYSFVGF